MDTLQPGQMLGPYRIVGQVGQGGMATVYQAYQPSMDRYVALKVLPRELAELPEFIGRFQQEARIIANLEHAHILPVHDYGQNEGYSYLVMRFLNTGTLKERMRERSLSLQEVDHYFSQLAGALEYAHDHGVIHRDIKPSNALVDAQGNLFLTDFGIAKLLEGSSQFTGTGAMIGTPDYMSPEQAQGLPVDRHTDIYSLGIILYEMVVGHVPFEADTPLAVVFKQISAPLPLPTAMKPALSPAIERVLLKALAKAPEDRYDSISAFHEAWKNALAVAETTPAAEKPQPAAEKPQPAAERPQPAAERPQPAAERPLPMSSRTMPEAAKPSSSAQRIQPAPPVNAALPTAMPASPPGQAYPAAARKSTQAATPLPVRQQAQPPVQPPVQAASPARPRRRLGWIIFGGLGGLVLLGIAVVALAVSFLPRLLGLKPTGAPEGVTATLVSGENTGSNAGQAPFDLTSGTWTSWVGANHMRQIAMQGDKIAAGGFGLVLWRKSDGSIEHRFMGKQDGLPDVLVQDLLWDEKGILWAATTGGVGRYDGDQWTIYNDEDNLDSSWVNAIALSSEGLLIGTEYCGGEGCGLNLLTKNGIRPFPGFPSSATETPGRVSNSIKALLVANNGDIWVGTTNGLARYDGQKWSLYFQSEGLPGNFINTLAKDTLGDVWAGTNQGAARFDGGQFQSLERLKDGSILGIFQDTRGNYWFSYEGGIARYAPEISDWQAFTGEQGLPSYNYYDITADSEGNLFFGSDAGLIRYDGKTFVPWTVPNVPAYGEFERILTAPDGNSIWFVRRYGGPYVDQFDPRAEKWSVLKNLPETCTPLVTDEGHVVWCGGGGGLWLVSPGGAAIHISGEQGLPSEVVTALALNPLQKGSAWVGTDNGVAYFDGKKIARVINAQNDALSSNTIQALLMASDGSLWVGTDKGLDRLGPDGQWDHYSVSNPFSGDLGGVTDVAEDAAGAIWVSTTGESNLVYRFAGHEWQRFVEGDPGVALPPGTIQNIIPMPDGSLWFASYYEGAARFDRNNWTLVRVKDGLLNPNVMDVYRDQKGAFWFATDGGATRYQPGK